MDTDVAARCLRLLTLLQTRPTWPAAELAERLDVAPRTLRRDLQRLTSLGYGIESRPGPGGHYRLSAGSRLPPMVFDDDEVVALVAGLRMSERGPTAEAASRALIKLTQVLPRRLAALAAGVVEATETVDLDPPEVPGSVQEELLTKLTAAAAGDLLTTFAYVDQHGVASRRRADSVRCLFTRGTWSLLAFDLDRDGWRVFRLDRVRDVVGHRPAPRRDPPADDLAAWMRSDFGRLGQPIW